MSKVITFSQTFPDHVHPDAGQPTYFVEKLHSSLLRNGYNIYNDFTPQEFLKGLSHGFFKPKNTTIRAGHRWKQGEYASPRVWSGKPYKTKQIILCSDILLKSVKDIQIFQQQMTRVYVTNELKFECKSLQCYERANDDQFINDLASNDGLTVNQWLQWFKIRPYAPANFYSFVGQILSWDDTHI